MDVADLAPGAYLNERLSIEEADRRYPPLAENERRGGLAEFGKPYHDLYSEWIELKALIKAGDEVWTFNTPPDNWHNYAGVALMRDGKVAAYMFTLAE